MSEEELLAVVKEITPPLEKLGYTVSAGREEPAAPEAAPEGSVETEAEKEAEAEAPAEPAAKTEADYVGVWNCTEFVSNGKTMTAQEYNAEMTLTLKEGGTGNLVLTMRGETKDAHITWKVIDSGIETTDITNKVVPFPLVDGKLQWQTDGGVLCIFTPSGK